MADQDQYETLISFDDDPANAEAPEPLPIGNYTATIVAASRRISSTNNPYVRVEFMIPTDQYPADYPVEEAPDGTRLMYNLLSLAQEKNPRYRFRRFCEAIGAVMSREMDLNEWVGLEAKVHIEHGEWEGLTRAEVRRVEAA
jgi:hypothetical protein